MVWKFRKRVTLLPGIRLNISRSGVSTTIGPRGASVNIGKKGTYLNTGLPGTGLYDRKRLSGVAPSVKADQPVTTRVQLSADLAADLDSYAHRHGLSRSKAIRQILEDVLSQK